MPSSIYLHFSLRQIVHLPMCVASCVLYLPRSAPHQSACLPPCSASTSLLLSARCSVLFACFTPVSAPASIIKFSNFSKPFMYSLFPWTESVSVP
ncbi:hypothetical protein LDENG_00132280 [Lucifuga dentata]|nr:hypothetical protein LDENG_00132280 [Lucifuga dentata]